MIIDSHCHLTYEPMNLDLDRTIERANNDNVKYLLTISTEDKSYKKILDVVKKLLILYQKTKNKSNIDLLVYFIEYFFYNRMKYENEKINTFID